MRKVDRLKKLHAPIDDKTRRLTQRSTETLKVLSSSTRKWKEGYIHYV